MSEPFYRPPGCVCKFPEQVCPACEGIPRSGPALPAPIIAYTTKALRLVQAIWAWTKDPMRVERRLAVLREKKEGPATEADVRGAMDALDKPTREGL